MVNMQGFIEPSKKESSRSEGEEGSFYIQPEWSMNNSIRD